MKLLFHSEEEEEQSIRKIPLNPKELPIGSIGYFVDKYRRPGMDERWHVGFGLVEEHYPSCICLTLLEPADRRLVNGIPYKDFQTPTEWCIPPKGWDWGLNIQVKGEEIYYEKIPGIEYGMLPPIELPDKTNPSEILRAYNDGRLVKSEDIDHSRLHTQWGNDVPGHTKKEFRVIRDFGSRGELLHVVTYESVNWFEVYKTYAEAKAIVDAHDAELERVTALSDYDWSVEQIDRTLNHWAKVYGILPDVQQAYRDCLLSFDNLEDLEVRIRAGKIEWKYFKNKRWTALQE